MHERNIPRGSEDALDAAAPTAAELRVLNAIRSAGTARRAAELLGLSPHTVDRHLDNLRDKTGIRHLVQLVSWAQQNGWLEPQA